MGDVNFADILLIILVSAVTFVILYLVHRSKKNTSVNAEEKPREHTEENHAKAAEEH